MENLLLYCTEDVTTPVQPTDALLDKISLEFPQEAIVLRDPRRLFINFVLADLSLLFKSRLELQEKHWNLLRQRIEEEHPSICAVYEVYLLTLQPKEKLESLLLIYKASLLSKFIIPVDLEETPEEHYEANPMDSPVRPRRVPPNRSPSSYSPKLEALNNLGLLRVYLPSDNYLLIEEVR